MWRLCDVRKGSSIIKLVFDNKTRDVLTWQGQVVMSRTEEPYFARMFELLASRVRPLKVLEIGFGLGISAQLIQKHFQPTQHHIVEVEAGIYADLVQFAQSRPSVTAHLGNWATLEIANGPFDFVFYDPFDYAADARLTPQTEAKRLAQFLAPRGVLCHPHFGDGPPRQLPGFRTEILQRLTVAPIVMADRTRCEEVAVLLKYLE